MKVLIISGTRPQFIKLSPVIREMIEKKVDFTHLHTGQHYDKNMSDKIFEDLDIPYPDFNLAVGSGSHAYQTGEMMKGIETFIQERAFDLVLVPGDTNSTLAGALSAVKLHLPVIHLEAGLRSHDWKMPEEINRIVVDRISSLLITPTDDGVENLLAEGVPKDWIYRCGDTMVDSILYASNKAKRLSLKLPFPSKQYFLATMHRAENVDDSKKLKAIIEIFSNAPYPVVFSIHPRTLKNFQTFGLFKELKESSNIYLIEPQGYLNFANLLTNAVGLITDSGGLQKEAFILGIPAITLRTTTEWVESVAQGANRLCGLEKECIYTAFSEIKDGKFEVPSNHPYGNGKAGREIVSEIIRRWENNEIIFPSE